jgi:hypothetical protein
MAGARYELRVAGWLSERARRAFSGGRPGVSPGRPASTDPRPRIGTRSSRRGEPARVPDDNAGP